MIFNEKWDLVLKDELEKDYFKKLGIFVKNEYKIKQFIQLTIIFLKR